MAAAPSSPMMPPLLVGLDALRAWDDVEPICPLCALYGACDQSAPPSDALPSIVDVVSVTDMMTGKVVPATALSSDKPIATATGATAAAKPSARARRSTFVHVSRPTSPTTAGPQQGGLPTPPPPPANNADARSSSSGPAAAAARSNRNSVAAADEADGAPADGDDGGACFPSDFPIYTSYLKAAAAGSPSASSSSTSGAAGGSGGAAVQWKDLSRHDTARLMTDHCYYSKACRWSLEGHEGAIMAAMDETAQRHAERRRHAAASYDHSAGGTDGGQGANNTSNFAVAKMRSLVSQEKRRFQEDGFDLDLTYITRRVIAMGFPSYGKEAYYRNPVGEVERFFQQRHGDGHFRIYNLCSERVYDDERRFNGQYKRYPFDDHNAPCPISLIADFVNDATTFLQQDRENVVAIHCKAGKGRTGLMICCLLRALESNKLRTAEEALNFFGTVRTNDGQGVTIPSQHRYVHYYDYILKNWQGVPPPRAPPVRVSAAKLGDFTAGSVSTPTTSSAPAFSAVAGNGFYKYIYLRGIVLDSPVFVGSEIEGGGSGGGGGGAGAGGGAAGSDYFTDISFTIEENNTEIFDSRKNTLLLPPKGAPFRGLPHHANTHTGAGSGAADSASPLQFGNTKASSKAFAVTTGNKGFSGYIFPLPTPAQAAQCPPGSALKAGAVPLKVAGDVRFTLYYRKQGLLGSHKETELLHFWMNSFMAQHMGTGCGGAAATSVAAMPDGSSPSLSTANMKYVRMAKHELDGVHKDTRHNTYCSNIGVTVYFSVEEAYMGGDIVPARSAKAKAMPDAPPAATGAAANQPPAAATSAVPPQQNSTAGAPRPTTAPPATGSGAPTATPPPQQQQQQKAPPPSARVAAPAAPAPEEKKEDKGFFKSIFKF